MKKILIVGAVTVSVVVGAAVFLFSSLDAIVRKIIVDVGSQVAGVPVSVERVAISLADGKASIIGLSVANPAGFSSSPAFSLGEVNVAIDTGSVGKSPVLIREVVVAAPMVSYELGTSGSNLDHLQANVKSFAGRHSAKSPPTGAGAPKTDERKLVIERLVMREGKVRLAAGGTGGAEGTARLPDITLTGIGKDSGGASAAQVAQQVLDALVGSAIKSSVSLKSLVGGAEEKVKALLPGDAGASVKGLLGK